MDGYTGADLGGLSNLKGREGVDDWLLRLGVFNNCGCRVILPGTSRPLLPIDGVIGFSLVSCIFVKGFIGFFYLT